MCDLTFYNFWPIKWLLSTTTVGPDLKLVRKIRQGTEELAALERLIKIPIYLQRENGVTYLESAFILRLIVYQAGNKDNYKNLDEYEFWQDSITDYGVSYPPASEKSMYDVVATVGPSLDLNFYRQRQW